MFGRTSQFEKLLEKSTSQMLLEPDWDSMLQICDCIRQGDMQPKAALTCMKRKIAVENPHVSKYALQTLECVVKNCGSGIHQEVATKEFMEFLKDQVKVRPAPVKEKILELIQIWSHAFRNDPNYKMVQDTYHLMKMEGHSFPSLKEADAMFVAETAPEWKDAEVCSRCRVAFGVVQRKHHCRNCGEVYCGKCSSKSSILPKYGIEKEVRVCDACYDSLNKTQVKKADDDLPPEYLASPLSKQSQSPPSKSEQDIQEEDELALALALSKSEHESKEKERDRLRLNYGVYSGPLERPSSPSTRNNQPSVVSATGLDTSDMDPELARYLNRNYWEKKSETKVASTTTPSAPVAASEPVNTASKIQESFQNGETDANQEQFLSALNGSLEIFINRMNSNSARGRSIANDSSVQSLFSVISNMHPQLMNFSQEQEDLRSHYESLQDKLAQLRDAREALDALREDYKMKKQREQEELERQRQIQMAQKLEIMRQKKHEYLEMQRQLALQRLQDQEREMQIRLEQQKQMTQIRQMQAYGYPQAYPPGLPAASQVPQAFNTGGSVEGSPVHPLQQQSAIYGQSYQGMPPVSQQGIPLQQGVPVPSSVAPANQMYGGIPQSQPVIAQSDQYQMPPPGAASVSLPSGYQAQPSGVNMLPGSNSFQQPVSNPGYSSQQPNMTQPSNVPPGQMPPQGYLSLPPSMDYQSFNMQNMQNALPQTNPTGYSQSQQLVAAHQQPTPQASFQQGMPPSQMMMQGQMKNSSTGQISDTQLISFD